MPKGDASVTDNKLLKRIEKFSRPVSVHELTSRLRWSRGKIDGAINRLQDRNVVAVVKVSEKEGQRMRFIGLPHKPYWEDFYHQWIVEQKNVLVNDFLGVLNSYSKPEVQMNEGQLDILKDYRKSLENLNLELSQKKDQIRYLQQEVFDKNHQIQVLEHQRSRIDPSIIQVIEEHLNLINKVASQKAFSPAELLKDRIPLILNENYDLFSNIISIVADDSRKEDDSLECIAALSILRRAGYKNRNTDHR